MDQNEQTQIDQSQAPQTIIQPSTTPPNLSKRNWYKYGFLGFVLLLVPVLIYFFLISGGNLDHTSVTFPTGVNQPTSTPNETANWQTFTSSKANYSFKYPPEWPLINNPPAVGCTDCVEEIYFTPKFDLNSSETTIALILVLKDGKSKTIDDYVNNHIKGDVSIANLSYTTVGSEKAISYTLSDGMPPLPIIEYVVVKNDLYYVIRLVNSIETNKNVDNNTKLFQHMLNTFKFSDLSVTSRVENISDGQPQTSYEKCIYQCIKGHGDAVENACRSTLPDLIDHYNKYFSPLGASQAFIDKYMGKNVDIAKLQTQYSTQASYVCFRYVVNCRMNLCKDYL